MRNLLQLLGTFVVFRLGAKNFLFLLKGCRVEDYPSSLGVHFPLLIAFVLVPSRTLRSLPEDVLLFVHEALFFPFGVWRSFLTTFHHLHMFLVFLLHFQ